MRPFSWHATCGVVELDGPHVPLLSPGRRCGLQAADGQGSALGVPLHVGRPHPLMTSRIASGGMGSSECGLDGPRTAGRKYAGLKNIYGAKKEYDILGVQ